LRIKQPVLATLTAEAYIPWRANKVLWLHKVMIESRVKVCSILFDNSQYSRCEKSNKVCRCAVSFSSVFDGVVGFLSVAADDKLADMGTRS
jgi:hypothetical protein